MLEMARQIGVQSGARIGIHNHLNNSQGGYLHEYAGYQAFRRPYRTGALAVSCANDAEKSLDGVGVFTLMKEIRINKGQVGNYQIYFEMKNSDGMTNVRARFYVNGIAVGAIQTRNLAAYGAKTDNYDVTLAAGDLLQIYGDPLGDTVWIRNFRIKYDWRIEYFGAGGAAGRVLAAPLLLTDADQLDFTNTLV